MAPSERDGLHVAAAAAAAAVASRRSVAHTARVWPPRGGEVSPLQSALPASSCPPSTLLTSLLPLPLLAAARMLTATEARVRTIGHGSSSNPLYTPRASPPPSKLDWRLALSLAESDGEEEVSSTRVSSSMGALPRSCACNFDISVAAAEPAVDVAVRVGKWVETEHCWASHHVRRARKATARGLGGLLRTKVRICTRRDAGRPHRRLRLQRRLPRAFSKARICTVSLCTSRTVELRGQLTHDLERLRVLHGHRLGSQADLLRRHTFLQCNGTSLTTGVRRAVELRRACCVR